MKSDRRQFLAHVSSLMGAMSMARPSFASDSAANPTCQLGLVTYLWGKNLLLPDLLSVCQQSGVLGVELRTTHKHGVEPSLSAAERKDVRSRFDDSPVTLVGLGSDERFDNPDPEVVRKAIGQAKEFIRLSADVGSSGIKVKGDRFYPDVARDRTLAQVSETLHEVGDYAEQFEQEVRLEVHGQFSPLPIHHKIISTANHPRVRTCWNSNATDLEGAGLKANFDSVRRYFGQTAHIRDLTTPDYPCAELISLLVQSNYQGWVLLEAQGEFPPREVAEKLSQQRKLFDSFLERARADATG